MKNKNIFKLIAIAGLLSSIAMPAFADRYEGENERRNERNMMDANSQAKNTAHNEKHAMMGRSRHDVNDIVSDATNVYRRFSERKSNGAVPASVINKAQCIAVVPDVVTAAAVIGGSMGRGLASCKTSDNRWSTPAFFSLNAASFGAQLGAKSTDVVMYFTNNQAVSALKRGKFEFGADASVVAGNYDTSFDTQGAGIVAYQESSGAFIGAALNGGSLYFDEEANADYYGKNFRVSEILEGTGRGIPSKTNVFASALPR